ncbi:Retrovirus-related pol polyprotein from transposon tnt 1-94 [Thalictrum thalictroides]|uniref:Retrovirus-related pol polyprotein from transposon tnt 1-94 n=1 Tax=Thalictrum thalictroides TaxID=46969 RepID=A0A7J6V9M8_THATH|nr:Retrovirus-related pol polyprotein from transposon tnt 1-94 [Thalictrum thalictroides]
MTKSLSNWLYRKQQLYRLRMTKGTSINDHLSVFNSMISELVQVGVKLEDEDQAHLLLNSMPPSYERIITTLLYGKETLELDEVVSALLSHELRHKGKEDESHGERLVVNGGSRKRFNKSKKVHIECWECGKIWHFRRDCEKKCGAVSENSSKSEKGKQTANSDGLANQVEYFDDELLLAIAQKKISNREWVLDSGATKHV